MLRVSVIHGHSTPFSHTERWLHSDASGPKRLAGESRECWLVSIIADGLTPGGLTPGFSMDHYLSRYSPRCECDGCEYMPPSQESRGVKQGAEIITRAGQLFEVCAMPFVTSGTTPWMYGQVLVRVSDGNIINCGPMTLSVDADLQSSTDKYSEKVRHTENRALYPGRRRQTLQPRRDAARSLGWWAREETLMEVTSGGDGPPDSQVPQR